MLAFVATASAGAQDLERTHFKIIGENSAGLNYKELEKPLWEEWIPKASNGKVTGDMMPFDQVGLDNATILRLLKQGAMDIGTTDASRLAADDPRFEGADLAGIALTIEDARRAVEAYRSVLNQIMEKNWNVKVLFWGPAPPQVFWCRVPISGLADLKGKKVRVFNKTMIDFLGGVGATAVSINFPEVVPALQRGVVDCAVTGTMSGNTAGWGEVTTHLYPMYMGWAIRFTAINLKTWDRITPEVRSFLLDEFKKYEDKYWDFMDKATKDAENCNVGEQPCTMGNVLKLKLVTVKPEEQAEHKRIMETAVLSGWVKRAGPAAAKEWNATVGKVLGLTAPTE
jgi:TRAP-type C4-dicarboxylate transport system substrate-binding protein